MINKILTSQEWQELHPDIVVMDPDGWDRKNYQFSWYEEQITEGEYFIRRLSSTCKFNVKKEVEEFYKIMDKEVHSNRGNLNK